MIAEKRTKSPPAFTVSLLQPGSTQDEIEAAVTVINDAFGYFNPPPDEKNFFVGDKTFMPDLHRYQILCGLVGGKVYVAKTNETSEVVGAAVWFGPGQELGAAEAQEEQQRIFNAFLEKIGRKYPGLPAWWTNYFLPTYSQFTSRVLGDPTYKLDAWHLQLIGVASRTKGQGIGTALMKVAMDEAALCEKPRERRLTVEAGPRGFYKALGFVERGEHKFESEQGIEMPLCCLSCDKESV
ncbi:hypothetical protein BDW22DRAFT_983313 [Trametopsis cervina]|nr:hypothetical protein BDW22DRAFT_983313 [Trametopsis cervina]